MVGNQERDTCALGCIERARLHCDSGCRLGRIVPSLQVRAVVQYQVQGPNETACACEYCLVARHFVGGGWVHADSLDNGARRKQSSIALLTEISRTMFDGSGAIRAWDNAGLSRSPCRLDRK